MSEERIVVEQVVIVKPEGKGMAVAGFILALLGIVVPFNVMAVLAESAAISYVGVAICLISVILCAMAMGKLGKTGGKKGLAVAGLVIGLVASVWAIFAVISINDAIAAKHGAAVELNKELEKMQQDIRNMD